MKTIKMLAAAAMLLSAVACNSGNTGAKVDGADSTAVAEAVKPVNPKALLPSKASVDSVSYLLGIQLGSMIKGYHLGELNFNMLKKGAADFVASKGSPRDTDFVKQFKVNPEDMNRIMNEFIEKRAEYVGAINKAEEAKFLEANKKKTGVQVTESGLQYIITEPGNDVKPAAADTVFVHYKGTLTDGTVFDESPKNDEGVRMLLNRVIKGWTEGLQLIGEGGKIKLFVPSELGYGENGQSRIEPNSTLIFDIELVKVNKVAATEEEAK